jgi:two-component system phosphate regulon sensor histidine kinase PhoR
MDIAHEKQIMIWVELDDSLPLLVGNKDALERLMSNLIENAINYSEAGSLISICTRREHAQVQIEVKDMGMGIGETELPRIFEHFYRADTARSTNTGGSGLGLAIVKKAVDIHGGAISVQSKPGIGTTFHITLPTLV